ncbi:hypothetical protein ACJZ2D_011262 [Fusarium nematophilum]
MEVVYVTGRSQPKRSAIKFVFLNIATIINKDGISVGIDEISWKLHLVYFVWIAIEISFNVMFFVETNRKNPEEISEMFRPKKPWDASAQNVLVAWNEAGHIIGIHETKRDQGIQMHGDS